MIRRQFGPPDDAVLARYSYGVHDGPYGAGYALGTVWTGRSVFQGMGGCQYQRLAGQFTSRQPRTFFYEFGDRGPPPPPGPAPPGFAAGVTHAAELPCLWPGTARKPLTPQRRRLSLEMVRYWGAFTKDAHPAGAHPKDADPATREQAAWPPYRSGKLMSLLPGGHSGTVTSEVYAARHQCSYWNRISYDWLTTEPADLARSPRDYSAPTAARSFAVPSGASTGKWWLPRSTSTMSKRSP
ncbi:hypothetical protein VT50_0208735 [Streptomyces antioxidans]|uniref:Carboxylesterase type B domain-containing protein n=1 Tax=Streptomyces antioxidans TaxID=1507734 RepID=A0A1V4D9C1_9ACTN|nr:carboxylesterase family protein [Streptomyces antioxidans]OPF81743.1 hypothetical protein VT50_0208735 [Streptomyces antioxidans]